MRHVPDTDGVSTVSAARIKLDLAAVKLVNLRQRSWRAGGAPCAAVRSGSLGRVCREVTAALWSSEGFDF
eukprot:1656798-Prymnesium_polylepis.1